MAANLPVAFAALLFGGLLLDKGLPQIKTAFGGGTNTPAASAPGAPTSSSQQGSVTLKALQDLGKAYGWTGQQINDWWNVIQRESGGRLTATNPTSGAYGIAQGITGPGWYAAHGGNVNTVTGQLTAMANYIAQRYGDPAAAWAHELSNGWY